MPNRPEVFSRVREARERGERPDFRGANLVGVDLTGADLFNADLSRADLTGADLTGARLDRADLTGANLRGARLDRADLTGADLTGARLGRADLRGARIDSATQIAAADLGAIRADVEAVLAASSDEVPYLLAAIREGRIDGFMYRGPCACLVGTLARARGCSYDAIPGLRPNASRPAERWFLAIWPGDTPERSPVAALTAQWVEGWLRRRSGSRATARGETP